MWKKHELVMLPTNKKAGLGSIYKRIKDDEIGNIDEFDIIGKLFINKNPNVEKSNSNFEAQHLYILSSEEIKEGDWYVNININKVLQCDSQNFGVINLFKHCKKIIATTDSSLKQGKDIPGYITYKSLPQPSQSFIEKYVEEYNKGNIITEVMVEYNIMNKKYNKPKDYPYQECEILKINLDNTINIKPIKNSWTKKEQFENIIKFRNDYEEFKKSCHFGPNNKEIDEWTNNWIEQNI